MSETDAHGAATSEDPQQPKPVTIAFVLYPGFTALDIIGPFQMLAYVPGHEAVFVAAEAGPVTDDTGRCQLTAPTSLGQLTAPDVVIIGGSLSTREPDQPLVQWLRQVHPTTAWTTSVCTGSIYLAAAGILEGQDATTHWAWAEQLERHGARYTEQRVVEPPSAPARRRKPRPRSWSSCGRSCTRSPRRGSQRRADEAVPRPGEALMPG
jgi:transcriptional regulator GlxA family with amidase domain